VGGRRRVIELRTRRVSFTGEKKKTIQRRVPLCIPTGQRATALPMPKTQREGGSIFNLHQAVTSGGKHMEDGGHGRLSLWLNQAARNYLKRILSSNWNEGKFKKLQDNVCTKKSTDGTTRKNSKE